ncbi:MULTISPECIES: acyl-CoA dehydrogenase family protein [unclassified Streptomyces]|uniref:acyl-CoA dehydrogenase family protein n=1 Tax=unclassified Streptomyces TaxID=2593676 RepID=UPI00087FB5D9|nr:MULTISPECIES: acyl-CoA dehydrogenase family protein [unclassified Streptomyces]PBC83067.1 alkylation response protein AidB-like acyl-CoA dehydrogenase [Streptomyces sp. 2321.6]SDR45244.1 Acyl-CoA dehydrogenase [Streptomyces sp. KS_16]SEC82690.1 Acyl-CoA dehydrogenase [Streptomyces sp. 2133.1]SNC69144.1 Acyl-CoA dehydrogenase [Streptomyces sp. 2114.4]
MDAAFTEEQHEIRRTLRELLLNHCGPDQVKAAVRTPPGYDPQVWHRLAAELGLPGLALPAAYGGVDCGPTELALACEETGRAVLPSPLIATAALAAPLILALGSERQRGELLPGLAGGELTGTLAVPAGQLATALGLTGPNDGDWAGGGRAGGVQARRQDGTWRLYGETGQVLNGHTAEVLVVAAHTGGFARSRTLLFLVRAAALGPEARPDSRHAHAEGASAPGTTGLLRIRQTALDETRPLARLELRDVPAELLGEVDGEGCPYGEGGGDGTAVAAALAATGVTAAAVLAAEAVGAADAALARTVAYVREREQFGRPIGSFQAVQHRLADLYVTLQAARSATYYAAWAAGGGRPGGQGAPGASGAAEPGAGALALAQALEALRAVAAEAVQLHGGIGFTWEHEAHLYFKRAAGDELLLGPVHRLRARAAEEAGLFTGGAGQADGGRRGSGDRGAGGSGGQPSGDRGAGESGGSPVRPDAGEAPVGARTAEAVEA